MRFKTYEFISSNHLGYHGAGRTPGSQVLALFREPVAWSVIAAPRGTVAGSRVKSPTFTQRRRLAQYVPRPAGRAGTPRSSGLRGML